MAIHKKVFDGRLVVARKRRQAPVPGMRRGYLYVEVLVYKGPTEESEVAGEWEMPKELPLNLAAQTAFVQTKFEEN